MKKSTLTNAALGLALAIVLIIGAFTMTNAAQATGLTSEDKAGLVFTVEEEKLAGDVYTAMNELWKLNPFANIARAELNHMEHVRAVLKAYNVADPTASAKPGEFTNAELQALYNDLVKKGSESVQAALVVAATIEDLDIADIEALRAKTKNADLIALYDSLINGSENHMRAFARQLKMGGQEYKPQSISEARYSQIVNGSNVGQGNGHGMGRGWGQGRGQGQGQHRGPGRQGASIQARQCDGSCESCNK